MDYLDLLQWPAMVVTVAAAWLVASRSTRKRIVGFWLFLVSNVLWMTWGWHQQAYALILLQVFLAAMNVRGVYRNDPELEVTTGKG
jgi:nicotinamide riboside transporter PnuC